MFVLDSHCDTPSQILRLRDLSHDGDYAQVDLPKLRCGSVDAAFFALYIPSSLDYDSDSAFEYACKLLEATKIEVEKNSDEMAFAISDLQAFDNKAQSRFSVFLGLENGAAIGESLDRLNYFYDRGVRYITLCHSGNNLICDSCATKEKKWGGLSPFGKILIRKMNQIGMLIDVSHASDETFYDVVKLSTKPIIASHSCCRALSNHHRNMTDDMILALAANGGVVQINFYPIFLKAEFADILSSSGILERGEKAESEFISDPADDVKKSAWNAVQRELMQMERPSYKLIADHIDHVVSLVGIDHVGIGSDFDGIEITPDGMENISKLPALFNELRSRGYSEKDLNKIASENFFRVMNSL